MKASDIKITKVNAYLLRKKLRTSMRISRGGFNVRTHLVVEVQTDSGISGLGEGVGNPVIVKAIVEKQMARQIAGFDPFNIEDIRKSLMESDVYFERKGSLICAASAIEMACWDIKGKALGVPVYQLLGGVCTDIIEAYASDVYWEDDAKLMADNARRIIDIGFSSVKIHIGVESPRKEVPRIAAIREAIGEETNLMIDVNAGYNYLESLDAVKLWREFDIKWLEEPVGADETQALKMLHDKVDLALAAGENEFRVHGFKDLFDSAALDVAMPDIGRVGGIHEAKKICTLASVYGIPVSPHNFSSGILLAATIHLMASTDNTTLLEVDTSGNAIYEELLEHPIVIENGCVEVPDCVGLGVMLREEVLNEYCVVD